MADNREGYLELLKLIKEQDTRISNHINKKVEFKEYFITYCLFSHFLHGNPLKLTEIHMYFGSFMEEFVWHVGGF